MEWLDGLLGAGAAVASGGLFGILGSVVGVVAKHYQEKARQAWEQKKWSHEETMHTLQMQANAQKIEGEIAIASSEGAWEGLNTSIEADAVGSKNTSRWVANIKSLFRPFLTLVLWGLAAYVFNRVIDITFQDWLATQDAPVVEMINYMVYTIFFTASSATTWWFGDRALTPPHMKHR